MQILGISCFCHDSAAALIKDGAVIAAASEERFSRQKNSPDFPRQAVNFCLQWAETTVYDVDYIVFYEKPFLKFWRVVTNHLRSYPFSWNSFLNKIPSWLEERLSIPFVLKKELGFEGPVLFIPHHLSHAASTFLVSPFEEAVILTADGVGEWATTTCGIGRDNQIKIFQETRFPDSLGLLYTAVTIYLGFEALEGEDKVMDLAAYGKPCYLDTFKKIVNVKEDGSYRVDDSFFGFNKGGRIYGHKFIKLFGKERLPDEEIQQRHCDMAATVQKLCEDVVIGIARNMHKNTGLEKLCLAGGLFLNYLINTRILEETPFKEVFIQPAAGDSGGALGAAAYVYFSLLGNRRKFILHDACLGPAFPCLQIKRLLINRGVVFKEFSDSELISYVAERIAQDKIVGWFQGRMEFGPRALGNRSILASPRNPDMKDMLNQKVKHREPFRPYAPAVLEERAHGFFEGKHFSPFMLLAARVRGDKKKTIPAVTHVDGAARVQMVTNKTNPKFWSLIKRFEELTGVPLLINASFNLKGEPIVCAPEDALEDFLRSEMDLLAMENYVIEK